MTQERPKGKRKYQAPATVWLGETARASGDCSTGESNVEGNCVDGYQNEGGGTGFTTCYTGPSVIGASCGAGGSASGGGGCSTGVTAP